MSEIKAYLFASRVNLDTKIGLIEITYCEK